MSVVHVEEEDEHKAADWGFADRLSQFWNEVR
jgi:hypothetical protein